MYHVNVIILSGGKGTRLRSIANKVPKSLVKINDTPFLSLLLTTIGKSNFIAHVYISIWLLHRKYFKTFSKNFNYHIRLGLLYRFLIISEFFRRGTGGATRHAIEKIKSNRLFLIMNGDTYTNTDLDKFINYYFILKDKYEHDLIALMMIRREENANDYGTVKLCGSRIVSMEEKRQSCGYVNAGIYLVNRKILPYIKRKSSLEYDVFPELAKDGKLFYFLSDATFIDMGTEERFTFMKKFDKTRRLSEKLR